MYIRLRRNWLFILYRLELGHSPTSSALIITLNYLIYEEDTMNYFKSILLFLLVTLAACGGGGSGTPSVSQGKFIDAAVEGITYTSGTLTGLTDRQGNFSYQAGQSVTFSIGGIILGTVSGSAIITPIQLVTGNWCDKSI